MALINALNNPKISDTILFVLETTDSDDNIIDPYKVNNIVIYHLERDIIGGNTKQFDKEIDGKISETYFSEAVVVEVLGNDTLPAWLSSDTDVSFIERTDTGTFELKWITENITEGDYIICWTWTPLPAGDTISNYFSFEISGDTKQTTSIPTHFTPTDKYETLLDRYLPEMFKLTLGDGDLTPTTLNKFQGAIAKGFTVLEDLTNQIVDLNDANATADKFLPFLASLFNIRLKSNDKTLWRRQIKNAIPLYKEKGTLGGLIEALAEAGIELNKFTQLFQIVSPNTWQEAFTIEGDEISFVLKKTAITDPSIDLDNYELYLRPNGSDDWIQLSLDYVTFSTDSEGVTTMTWVGDALSVVPIILEVGDTIRIIYKYHEPDDQSIEDYIRTLSLADLRDDRLQKYPPKNWNVRVIAIDDLMLDVICSTRNPFIEPLIYGEIRTEFPYSENIYNMESYNGSTRPTKDPCYIGKDFLDSCGCCLSSKYILDLGIEDLSDDRITEAREVITKYTPFHSVLHQINFSGKVSDFMLPPLETIQALVYVRRQDNFVIGQTDFTRIREGGDTVNAILRDAMANSTTVVVDTGAATNDEIVLFSPGRRFDRGILGVNENANYLQILSGANEGEYQVANPNKNSIGIVETSPDSIGFPLSTSSFPFHLSNQLFSGSITSIQQSDLFTFTDSAADFRLTGVQAGWKVIVTAPFSVIGTYEILRSLPDDSIIIEGWPITTALTNISYQLMTDEDIEVGDSSTSGAVNVIRRGLVDAGSSIKSNYQLNEGHYFSINGTQYQIVEFVSESEFIITNYTGGAVGVSSVKIYNRLIDTGIGYLQYKGMTLITPVDHEVSLSITNGANLIGTMLEDNNFKENFLIYINSNYYKIIEIDGTTITINGPMMDLGLSGSSLLYSIIHFEKVVPAAVASDTYNLIDRRSNEKVTYSLDTITPMTMASKAVILNAPNNVSDAQEVKENVKFTIEWKK